MTMIDNPQPPQGGKPAKPKPEKKKPKVKPKDKLAVLAGKINTATGLLLVSFRSSLSHARIVGGLCRQAQTRCEAEGENFREWCSENVKKLSYAHILNYIRLYDGWKKVVAARKNNPALTMTEAIKLVATGKGKGGKAKGKDAEAVDADAEKDEKEAAKLLAEKKKEDKAKLLEGPDYTGSALEQRGVKYLLVQQGKQGDPATIIGFAWRMAVMADHDPEGFLERLRQIAKQEESQQVTAYLASLKDISEDWDEAVKHFESVAFGHGSHVAQKFAETLAMLRPADVRIYKEELSADGSFPPKEWDTVIAMAAFSWKPNVNFLVRSTSFNVKKMALAAAEAALTPVGAKLLNVQLDNKEEVAEVRSLIAAYRSSLAAGPSVPMPDPRPEAPAPNPQPEPPTTEPEPQEERQNLPPRQLPKEWEADLNLEDNC